MKRTVGVLWDEEDAIGGSQEFYFDHGKSEMSAHPSGEVGWWNLKPKGRVALESRSGRWHLVLWNWMRSPRFSSVTQSCPTLCDPMNRSMPGLPVHHQLPEFTQTHVHQVGDAIQPSHPLLSPSPPAPNPSQHRGLFQWVNSLNDVAKVLEFQLQHQSFQWTPRTDLLQDGLAGPPCRPRDSQESPD